MKLLIILTLTALMAACTSVQSNNRVPATADKGEIIKPENTLEAAVGTVTIKGYKLNYSVTDRGWTTIGTSEGGKVRIKAEKSFLLDYSTDNIKAEESLRGSIEGDAEVRCMELGKAEFEDKKAMVTAIKAHRVNSRIANNTTRVYDDSILSLAACIVTIDSKEE